MRRASLVLAVLGAAAAAGCSGSSASGPPPAQPVPSTTSSTTAPPSPATPVAPGSSAPGSPTIPPSSPPVSAVAASRCTTSSLRLSYGQGGAAAGTYYLPLLFTNTGSTPCVLRGYPGVSFVDENGGQVGVPARRAFGEPVRPVTLAPGERASANLGMPSPANYSHSDCRPATSTGVRAYPPDETASLTVNVKQTVCTTKLGRASIGPVRPEPHR